MFQKSCYHAIKCSLSIARSGVTSDDPQAAKFGESESYGGCDKF